MKTKKQKEVTPFGLPYPTEPNERVTFCFAFGDYFDGENFDDAIRYARFCVNYCKGMGLGLFAIAHDEQSRESDDVPSVVR